MSTEPVAGRVLREVLATPAFRELLRIGWGAEGQLSGAARELLGAEPQLPLELATAAPRVAAELLEVLVTLGERLGAMPAPLRQELYAELASGLAERLDGLDWGRARQALEILAGAGGELTAAVTERLLGDPVALANLVILLPAAANAALASGERAVAAVAWLPDELLASAAINLFGELDAEVAGRLVERLLALLERLHQGNLVLGGEGPALRPALVEALERVLSGLTPGRLERAADALGDDAELLASVLLERLLRDPEALAAAVRLGGRAAGRGLELLAGALDELEQLPPETRAALAGELAGALRSPAGRRLAGALGRWAAPRLSPEALAGLVNRGLARFNRQIAARPDPRDNVVAAFVGALDGAELERAWRNGLRLASSMVSGRALVAPLLDAAVEGLRRLARRRPFGRRVPGGRR